MLLLVREIGRKGFPGGPGGGVSTSIVRRAPKAVLKQAPLRTLGGQGAHSPDHRWSWAHPQPGIVPLKSPRPGGVPSTMLQRAISLSALALAALTSACEEESPLGSSGGTFEQHLQVGGVTRDYIVHVPPDLDPSTPAPLLFVFHGAEDTAEGMMMLSWFNAEARRRGFVVVYPEAEAGRWDFAGLRDLALVDAVVERIGDRITIDQERLFTSGFSNGALMAIWTACNRSDQVAGVGIVAGTILSGLPCTFRRPVPAVFFLGDEDRQFPFDAGQARIAGQLSASESMAYWLDKNGCSALPVVVDLPDAIDDGTTVHRWDYPECTGAQTVTLYEVRGGGHTWPGSPLKLPPELGGKSKEIRASTLIADFLMDRSGGP